MRHDWAQPVLATTEDGVPEGAFPKEAFPPGVAPRALPRWLQAPGDLGAKIEGIVRRALEEEAAEAVLCCGADSPGRPAGRLEEALGALLPGRTRTRATGGEGGAGAAAAGADVVLGPTEDGGYDIIGLRTCPNGLFDDLPWSQPTTFEASKRRFEERGLQVAVLEKWWDVDEVEDLQRLQTLLRGGGASRAPATAAAFSELKLHALLDDGARQTSASAPGGRPLRKPKFRKVDSLRPGARGLNLMLKCVSCAKLLVTGAGQKPAWDVVCGDDVATVTLRLYQEEQASLCDPGASLRVQNARVSMIHGRMHVTVDKWAVIKLADAPLDCEPNVANDASAVEYEQVE